MSHHKMRAIITDRTLTPCFPFPPIGVQPLAEELLALSQKMSDSQSCARMLNPCVLHLQKLDLELKCPSCLELYNKPILLPCNHIFCGSCVPESGSYGSQCALCKHLYLKKDIRQAPFIESIVNIYRCLDVTVSPHMRQMDFVKTSSGPLPSFSQTKLKQGDEAMDLDTDQLNLLSQGSPPCFGVNSSDPGSGEDSLERHDVKKLNKRLADEFTSNEVHSSTSPLANKPMKAVKRPKQETNGTGEMIALQPPQTGKDSKDSSNSREKMKSEAMVSSDCKSIQASNMTDSPTLICEFCQTWKSTEYTGPMVHYLNGKAVVGKEATGSGVIHVHSKCIEWAPQIFFSNEGTLQNLNEELQRGAKIKCCKCKLKGAALGCYSKRCKRSYHIPCAAEMSECRWDVDNFLMLCPTHALLKFPSEKSKKKHSSAMPDTNHDIPAVTCDPAPMYDPAPTAVCSETEELEFWAASPAGAKKWVFCASSLSTDEKCMLLKFARMCGATVMRSWSPTVTHVIAATDATGACTRTRKVLMAILKGKWVLKIDWLRACMKINSPVDEEPYEISLDNHGCLEGPKTGRLRNISNAPKLFSGLKFLFTGDFVRTYMEDLQDLIIAAGGTLCKSKEQLEKNDNAEDLGSNTWTRLIIYNCDSFMGTGDGSDVSQRQLEAEALAVETISQATPHTWLLDSIASCSLQPFALLP